MTAQAAISVAPGDILNLDAVVRVMEDSFDPAYGEAWTAPQCAGLLPLPGVWLSLAQESGHVIGFSLSRVVLDEAELLLLAVKKSHQGMGVGKLLLKHFADDAKRLGATQLHLEVRDTNPAVKLYNSLGFSEIGRRKGYYTGRDGQLHDAITLAQTVS